MDIKDVYQITFSPTGTSRRVAEAIVRGTGIERVAVADVTLETEKSLTVPRQALAVFAVLAFNFIFIGLLLTPLGVGGDTTGNQAWLKFPGIPFQIGPAEVVKITLYPWAMTCSISSSTLETPITDNISARACSSVPRWRLVN